MTTRWIFIVESSLNFTAFVDIIFSMIYSPTYHSISFLASFFLNTRSLILNITLSPLLNFFTSFYSLSACCFISSFLVLSLPLHVPSILFLQISLHFLLLISFIYLLLFLFIIFHKRQDFCCCMSLAIYCKFCYNKLLWPILLSMIYKRILNTILIFSLYILFVYLFESEMLSIILFLFLAFYLIFSLNLLQTIVLCQIWYSQKNM